MNRQNPIVDPEKIKTEAYEMGYSEFQGFSGECDPEDLHYFKEGARWANSIAPSLRELAGMADGGHGTYQLNQVVETTDGEDVEACRIYTEVVSMWDNGARDALEDMEKDPLKWM